MRARAHANRVEKRWKAFFASARRLQIVSKKVAKGFCQKRWKGLFARAPNRVKKGGNVFLRARSHANGVQKRCRIFEHSTSAPTLTITLPRKLNLRDRGCKADPPPLTPLPLRASTSSPQRLLICDVVICAKSVRVRILIRAFGQKHEKLSLARDLTPMRSARFDTQIPPDNQEHHAEPCNSWPVPSRMTHVGLYDCRVRCWEGLCWNIWWG